MHFFVAILTAAVVSASAISSGLSSRQQFPTCAGPCLTHANIGTCQPTDYGCLCRSSVYINSVSSCIASTCSGADLQVAVSSARQLCASVGVSLTNTLPSSTATSSGSTTGTSTTQSPASTSNAALANGVTRNTIAGAVVLGLGALAL